MTKEKFAYVEIRGQQFFIKEGDRIVVPYLGDEYKGGEEIVFDNVLYFRNGDDVKIGNPNVQGVKVHTKFLRHFKLPKIIVFKYKRRKKYRRKRGHRQVVSEILVEKIS